MESAQADPLEPNWFLVGTRTSTLTRNGNAWTVLTNRSTRTDTVASPEGRQGQTIYDALWRPQTLVRPGIANQILEYDERGRLATQTIGSGTNSRSHVYGYYASGPQSGLLQTITDPEGRATLFEYDAAGRVARTTLPGARTIQFGYGASGNLTTFTPPGRPSHTLAYTETNRASTYTPPAAGMGTPATLYLYNRDEQLVQVTRPDNQQIAFNYDTGGRIQTVISPRGAIGFSYSPTTGQLTGISEPSGQALTLTYDGQFPIATTWTGSVSGNVTLTYNADSFISGVSVNGQNVDFAYDRDGLLTRAGTLLVERAAVDGRESDTLLGVVTTTTGYSQFGEVTTFQAASSSGSQDNVANQIRSEIGQLGTALNSIWTDCEIDFAQAEYNSLISAAQGLPADTQTYDPAFAQFRMEYENSLRPNALFECGLDDLVAQADVSLAIIEALRQDLGSGGGSSPQTVFSQEHVRDRLGRITQTTERIESVESVRNFGYDTAGRLIEVTVNGSAGEAYSYDANGNRLTASGVVASYDDQDRLLAFGQTSFTYTENGELLTRVENGQTTTYTYDVFGNLRAAQLADGRTVEYVVDGQHRRIGKRINGTLVQGLLYQGQIQVAAELDGSGNIVSRFVYGTVPNVPDYMVRGGATYRIVTDHVGSPRLVMNAATGQVMQRLDYDAFGNVVVDTNPGFQPFGFAGGLYDRDTRLVRFAARDYDAQVGRWTAKDPILFDSGDTNLYGYVLFDPVNRIDINGLWSVTISLYRGYGGSITVGHSDGKSFALVDAGAGLGVGLTYNPAGDFPRPEGVGPADGPEGFIGFQGTLGVKLGPIGLGGNYAGGGYFCKGADNKVKYQFAEGTQSFFRLNNYGIGAIASVGVRLGITF